jgi:hypothetical protein
VVSELNPGRPQRSAFEGTVYLFERARRVRSGGVWFRGRGRELADERLYTYALWVPGRLDKRVDNALLQQKRYVGVDYETTVHWPQSLSGICSFRLTSDAGAIFQINGEDIIDHDGSHGFEPRETVIDMQPGPHHFRLAYLQGPRSKLGLILHYRNPKTGGWQLFDLRDILRENLNHVDHPLADQGDDSALLP